jgi:hypothetical protein
MMSTLQELAQTHPFLVGLGASAVAGAGATTALFAGFGAMFLLTATLG